VRRATNDTGWIELDGALLGVALGFDFVAEHEFGTRGIREDFDLSGGPGTDGRKMRAIPKNLMFLENQDYAVAKPRKNSKDVRTAMLVLASDDYQIPKQALVHPSASYYDSKRDDVVAFWDERSFAVIVQGDENIIKLRRLWNAMMAKDVLVGMGPGTSFMRKGGLTFMIDAEFPKQWREDLLAADLDAIALDVACKQTGIADRLKAAGRRYYALSPRWCNKEGVSNGSKDDIRWWLNPCDQDKNNYGWFSLAQLEEWIQGKGPIPKT